MSWVRAVIHLLVLLLHVEVVNFISSNPTDNKQYILFGLWHGRYVDVRGCWSWLQSKNLRNLPRLAFWVGAVFTRCTCTALVSV